MAAGLARLQTLPGVSSSVSHNSRNPADAMLQLLLLVLVGVHLASAQHVHRYHKFPVAPGHETECKDHQTGKFYAVGTSWATTTNNCKKSFCIREGNDLYIDRIQCDPVDKILKLLKAQAGDDVFCRTASGNRLKPFPGCCPSPVCKRRVNGRLVVIPRSEYPELPDKITYPN